MSVRRGGLHFLEEPLGFGKGSSYEQRASVAGSAVGYGVWYGMWLRHGEQQYRPRLIRRQMLDKGCVTLLKSLRSYVEK